MDLSDVKTYLRVDGDDEDALIQNLITAAERYAKAKTGKTKVIVDNAEQDIATDDLWCLGIKLLVADAYENRLSETSGTGVARFTKSADRIFDFIAMCGDYV